MKFDSLGRTIKPSMGGAGCKHLPIATGGEITGNVRPEDMPETLGAEGVRFWTEAVAHMEKMRILERADLAVLQVAAETWESMKQGQELVRQHGMLMESQRGMIRNPVLTDIAQCRTALKSFLSELGLTPSARAKFGPMEQADPFAEFLG